MIYSEIVMMWRARFEREGVKDNNGERNGAGSQGLPHTSQTHITRLNSRPWSLFQIS